MSSHEDEKLTAEFGFTDCHGHAYGPYALFPLVESRTFDPPDSPIVFMISHPATLVLTQH